MIMDYLSLCLICKDENDYLPEWLDYHILMGVDRFYIYDNDSQVSLRESLAEYITRGWVVVMDIPGKAVQLFAYDHCLHTFGSNTFWMGFIDTDEFLVPKKTLNLKDLLKDYEKFGGLAVSSLFFGSNHHQNRPPCGQIAGYTLRTHPSFQRNGLIKCIVQPGKTQMPNSPHDFIFKENAWCVNEKSLRVDFQMFPNSIDIIQLNHYFCRSESEINQKLARGRGDVGESWERNRYQSVNAAATIKDVSILQDLQALFSSSGATSIDFEGSSESSTLLDEMAELARTQIPSPIKLAPPQQIIFSQEMVNLKHNQDLQKKAGAEGNYEELKRLILINLEAAPQRVILYVNLAVCHLELNDPGSAWQALSQAWQLAENSFSVLIGMANFFLRVQDFGMAEKTCYILLDIAPNDLRVLGMMTDSLIGQGRHEEALKIGIPLIEISGTLGELPDGMDIYLIHKMAAYLEQKQDYPALAHLWELGIKCKGDDLELVIKLIKVLLYQGDHHKARQWLIKAQQLAPHNDEVMSLSEKVNHLP